jgi:Tol biopolymer transport system component
MVTPLWIIDADGHNPQSFVEQAQWPVWVGNGQSLAYIERISADRARLHIKAYPGGSEEFVTDVPYQRLFRVQDGKIAFVNDVTEHRLLYAWSNNQVSPLSNFEIPNETDLLAYSPSPDTHHLAYVSNRSLWLANLQTGEIRKLTDDPWISTKGVTWSPQSDRIVYITGHEGTWLMSLQTYTKTVLSTLGVVGITWAPAGEIVVLSASTTRGPGTAALLEIYLINSDATGLNQLTANSLLDAFVAWQPDTLNMLVTRSDVQGQGTSLEKLLLGPKP